MAKLDLKDKVISKKQEQLKVIYRKLGECVKKSSDLAKKLNEKESE